MKANMQLFALLSTVWMAKHTALAQDDECGVDTDNFGCKYDVLNCVEPYSYTILPPVGGPSSDEPESLGQSFYARKTGPLREVQIGVKTFPEGRLDWKITTALPSGLPDEGNTLGSGTVDLVPSTQLVLSINTLDQNIRVEAGTKYYLLVFTPADEDTRVSLNWYGFNWNSDVNGTPAKRVENAETPAWEFMPPVLPSPQKGSTLDLSIRTIVGAGTNEECALQVAQDLRTDLKEFPNDPNDLTVGDPKAKKGRVKVSKKEVKKILKKIENNQLKKACRKIYKLEDFLKKFVLKGQFEATVEMGLGAMKTELACKKKEPET